MPIALQTDRSQNLTILTASGQITFAEAMEALKSFYKNPNKNILLNFSHRTNTTLILKTEDLAKIFSHLSTHKEKRPAGKIAFVSPDDLCFSTSRIAEAFAEIGKLPWEMKAFRSIDKAINWLGASE